MDGKTILNDAEWEETFFERCRRQRWAWANAALPQIGKAMWTDADVQWFMLAQMQRSLEDFSREQKDVLRFAVAYIGWLNLCELTEDALAKIAPLETEETIERCDTLTRQLCDQRQVANRALNDLRMAVKMLDGNGLAVADWSRHGAGVESDQHSKGGGGGWKDRALPVSQEPVTAIGAPPSPLEERMDGKTIVEGWGYDSERCPHTHIKQFPKLYCKLCMAAAIDTALAQREAEARASEREACCQTIRAACGACGGEGGTVPFRGYVTREMALDAGEPMMEGQPMYGQLVECEYCGRPIAAIRARTP